MNASNRTSDRFWIGLSFGILLMFTLANLAILVFAVPKFGLIYQDALPGKPLPFVTELILAGRFVIILLNLAWLILSAYLIQRGNRRSVLFTNLAAAWNFLQAATTVVALLMPMVGTITGIASISCA